MKIARVDGGEVFIPLAKPFKIAPRTVENVEDIVVRAAVSVICLKRNTGRGSLLYIHQ